MLLIFSQFVPSQNLLTITLFLFRLKKCVSDYLKGREKGQEGVEEEARKEGRRTTKLYVQKYYICMFYLIFLSEHQEEAIVLKVLYYM